MGTHYEKCRTFLFGSIYTQQDLLFQVIQLHWTVNEIRRT